MDYVDRMDNIYMIDTKMFGLDHYMSAYLIAGKEIALIDTGVPTSWDTLRAGIQAHGFSLQDITYVFVNHQHPDHIGNVSRLLQESPKANVYLNPIGLNAFYDWSDKKKQESDKFIQRAGFIEPTASSRIRLIDDGDQFDLGNDVVLEAIFTPGHLPDGITLMEHKHSGLFIGDLIGNYFPDAESHIILVPAGSDIRQQIISMSKLLELPVKNLYMSHFGIKSDNVKELMLQTLDMMRKLLEIGETGIKKNKPEYVKEQLNIIMEPYLENMRKARGEKVYEYITSVHLPFLIESYTKFCWENLNKQ